MSVKTPSKLEKILSEGHLAVTSECGPPRGSDPEAIIKKAELIKDHVDAINITDNFCHSIIGRVTVLFFCPAVIDTANNIFLISCQLPCHTAHNVFRV